MSNLNLAYVPSGNFTYDFSTANMVSGVRHSVLVPSGLVKRKLWFNFLQTGAGAFANCEINGYLRGALVFTIPMARLPSGQITVGINAQIQAAGPDERFVLDNGTNSVDANPYPVTCDLDRVDFLIKSVLHVTLDLSFLAVWSENLTPPL